MTTDYQQRLMTLGNVTFEDIQDDDILTFEQWEQGFGMRCFYYLYSSKGHLKDIQCGKAIPLTERKQERPVTNGRYRDALNGITHVPEEDDEEEENNTSIPEKKSVKSFPKVTEIQEG